jgi:hypothetical protein
VKNQTLECPLNYSNALRAIGHALEKLQVETFEITCAGENYVVWAKTQKKTWMEALQRIFRRGETANFASGLRLIYTPQNIQQLETEGQAKRQNGGMPDAYTLQAALRAAGAYVDIKEARLRQITRRDGLIVIEYQSSIGAAAREIFTPAALYAVCLRMYLKRRSALRMTAAEINRILVQTLNELKQRDVYVSNTKCPMCGWHRPAFEKALWTVLREHLLAEPSTNGQSPVNK